MSRSRIGFSLIEVVVVIAIISVVIALTMPAIARARESARNAQCKNNLRQIYVALAEHPKRSAANNENFQAGQVGGWPVEICRTLGGPNLLPIVGQPIENLEERFRDLPQLLDCPSISRGAGQGRVTYADYGLNPALMGDLADCVRNRSSDGDFGEGQATDIFNRTSTGQKLQSALIGDLGMQERVEWLASPTLVPQVMRTQDAMHRGTINVVLPSGAIIEVFIPAS